MKLDFYYIRKVLSLKPGLLLIFAIFIFSKGINAQVTIFTEGFEHGSSMPNGWTQEYVYDTLNWVCSNGGNSNHPSSAHSGSYNTLLYYGGVYRTTKLVSPPIDLSLYTNVQLKFWHAQEDYSGDQDYLRIFYKTSATGAWTVVDSYTTSISIWTQRTISLPNPSSTYYISFEGEARYGYGIVVDDIQITGNVASGLDIALTGIASPIIWGTGNNTLKVNCQNLRSDTIYNVDFGYKLDANAAVIDTNISITDTLFPNGTKVHTFTNAISLTQGSHQIKVWANKPNRTIPDQDSSNDTLTLNFTTGIQDTFIINANGPGDYSTFAAAVANLNHGVTGPTVFIVKPGTYTERVVIGNIPGSSTTNTITFMGVHKDSVTLTFAGTNASNRATIALKGADHVSFRNMKIQNTATIYAVCVLLRNQSDYNTISNCILQLSITTNNAWAQVILMSSNEGSLGDDGNNGNYNLFENNIIIGGYYGARIHGTNTASLAMNNKFIGNVFTNQRQYGIYSYYQNNLLIKGNTLKSFRNNGAYGLLTYYSTSTEVISNIIQPGRIAMYFYRENYYAQPNSSNIINNMISNFRDPIYQMGIYANNYCDRLNILHNSIKVNGDYNFYSYAAIRLHYYCRYSVIKNNILSSTSNTYLLSLYYPLDVSIDYNDYHYDTTSSLKFYNNSAYSNFSTFRISSSYLSYPHDQNSYDNINPGFISQTNLHLDTSITPSLMAPYFGVISDLDNDSRDSTFGCNLGADEINHPAIDVDIVNIDSPVVVSLGNNQISLTLRNSGTDTLSAQTIYLGYKINGGNWINDSLILSNPLLPFASKSFSFGTPWNVTSNNTYSICARIYPQISNDPDSGDSLCVSKCVGLKDTFFIDALGTGQFLTFNSAINALTSCGIAGPVHFIIKPGTYVERVLITEIPGISSTNTITFEGADKDSVTLIYAGTDAMRATLVFDGADHVVFKNIKVQNNGLIYGIAAYFRNGADSNTISNCYLMVPNSSSTNINAVLASNAENSYAEYGNTGNYNLFENNIITGGYYGARLNGKDKNNICRGNMFIGNTFKYNYSYGIYMAFQGREEIQFNKLSNFLYTYATGIYNYYCTNSIIDGNIIKPGRQGIVLNRENYNFTTKSSLISNNMISNFSDPIYQIGIHGYYYCYRLKILHNSIWVNGTSTNVWYPAIRLYHINTNSEVQNNILTSTNNSYLLSLYNPRNIKIDYNNYYYPNSALNKFYNHAYFSNLTNFKNSTYYLVMPHDTNSYDNINPGFISASNLHLSDTVSGLPGDTLNILWDVDGDSRCTPIIGADEAGPIADFSINDTVQCFNGNNFSFTNTSKIGSGSLSYSWSFGDTSSNTTTTHPSYSYSFDSTFMVKLKVTSNRGCTDSIIKSVYVYASPSIAYSVNDSSQCFTANNFTFTNSSSINSGSLTYNWTFGDGYSATIASPSHSYLTTDTFSVKLIATSNKGCIDSIQRNVYVHPMPYSDFAIINDSQCFNENIFSFTNNSSIISGTMSYNWYFGDNQNTTVVNPSHTYSNVGNFTVKLKITSGQGCLDSIQTTITVHPSPIANFSINDSTQCFTGNNFSFTNTSSISTGSCTYNWSFGDNNYSTSTSPSHSYLTIDTFFVRLIASSNNGCPDTLIRSALVTPMPISNFSINDSTQCLNNNNYSFTNNSTIASGTMTHVWHFADSSTASSKHTSHSYLVSDTLSAKLISTSSFGCKDSIEKTVYIFPSPVTNFTINDSAQCISGNNFTFTNTSAINSGSLTYQWSFGDGISSGSTNATHIYSSNSTFQAKLIATSNLGCLDSVIKNVYVLAGPITNFAINDSLQCLTGNNFIFYDSSTISGSAFSTYDWNFGDGNSSTATSPTHSYLAAGNFFVKLIINSSGCFDSMAKWIHIDPSPIALFTINDTIQCLNGNNFSINNASTITSGTMNYFWDFGDNDTSNLSNPTHSYLFHDTFNVKLVVTSNLGCEDSIFRNTYVYPSPTAAYSVNDTTQCFGDNFFIYTNTSSIPYGSVTYYWDFGDGTSTTNTSPNHLFTTDDTFQVKLVLTSNLGCKDSLIKNSYVYPGPDANFSINDSSQCLNINNFSFINSSNIGAATPTYIWHFGDNDTSTQTNPNHTYLSKGIFAVKLIVSPDSGCQDSIEKTVYIYPSPITNFHVNDSSQCLSGNDFAFTDSSTIDTGSLSYFWDFRNGNTSTVKNPNNSYNTDGDYHVIYVTTSSLGCSDTLIKTIYVRPMPIAAFSTNSNSQCLTGNDFEFTNNSAGSINSNYWLFGDGNSSMLNNPLYSYLYADSFTVELFITDIHGCIDSTYKIVVVHPMPVSEFTVNDTNQCFNHNRFIISNTSGISSGSLSHNWKFGDGNSSILENPIHSYSITGNYKIELTTISNMNCIDSSETFIYINHSPSTDFTIDDEGQCLNTNHFLFTNKSNIPSGTLTYMWEFDDGNSTNDDNTNHAYSQSDTFAVKLIGISDLGCNDTFSRNVYVYPMPTANFKVNDNTQCYFDNNFLFTNQSTISSGMLNYLWDLGDGTTIYDPQPVSHVYSEEDTTFYVKLVTTSFFGCMDIITFPVYLLPSPHVDIGDTIRLKANEFKIVDAGAGFKDYLWNTGHTGQQFGINGLLYGDGTFIFSVIVTGSNNCKASDSIVAVIGTGKIGIDDITHQSIINIYPNPSDGLIKLELTNPGNESLNVSIINTTSQVVYHRKFDENTRNFSEMIDLSNEAKGIFILRVQSDKLINLRKLIIH